MSAFAIVLASTACAGNSGENKKSNEPTKEADLQSLIFTQPGAVRVKHFTSFSKNLARSTVVK